MCRRQRGPSYQRSSPEITQGATMPSHDSPAIRARNQGLIAPPPEWGASPEAFTAQAAPVFAGHPGVGARFIEDDQPMGLFEPRLVYRGLFCSKPMRLLSRALMLAWKASCISCDGRWPMAPCRRSVLYQLTHCRVSHSTRATDFHAPKNSMTSVLNRPMTLSARALSQLSPTPPTEVSIPASARRSV